MAAGLSPANIPLFESDRLPDRRTPLHFPVCHVSVRDATRCGAICPAAFARYARPRWTICHLRLGSKRGLLAALVHRQTGAPWVAEQRAGDVRRRRGGRVLWPYTVMKWSWTLVAESGRPNRA